MIFGAYGSANRTRQQTARDAWRRLQDARTKFEEAQRNYDSIKKANEEHESRLYWCGQSQPR